MILRRFFVRLAIHAVIWVSVFGIGWLIGLQYFHGIISDSIAEAGDTGYRVAYEELNVGGFPWLVEISLSRITIAPPRGDGIAPWIWSAPRLNIEVPIFTGPLGLLFIMPETQRLDYGGLVMDMTLESGVARFHTAKETLESLNFDVIGIKLETPQGQYSLDSLTGLIQRDLESRIDVEVDGRGLTLSPQDLSADTKAILGREISLVGIAASHGGELPEDLSGPALGAWSANGGMVEFERLDLEWGSLEIAADGALTLDQELRPEAAFSAEMAGYGEVLDGLAASGRMQPRDASFAKTYLNLMAKNKAGRKVIRAPITAQGGNLFIGPLPLIKLAPIY